ncbi:MAG TPA: glycosyltransferase family 4 protein [Nitrospiria bacterium]|nr:glycosyltransferase family 4 protein [Nitrospiria bacterium]
MVKPLRILNISLGGGRAGSGVFAVALAKYLRKSGHEVVQACSSNSFTLRSSEKERLNTHIIDVNGLFDFNKAKQLAEFSNKQQFQIINTHHSRERYLAAFAKMLYGCKARIVVTRHAVSGTVPFFGSLIYNLGADMNIAVSKVVLRSLRNDLTWKTKLIYGGIDLEAYKTPDVPKIEKLRRQILEKKKNIPIIGMVADFDPKGKNTRGHGKGHALMFEAIKLLKQKAFLIVIGPLPADCLALMEIAKNKGLTEEDVAILPFQEEIFPFYYLMDMHVLPSYSESLGLVILEAMAAGVPCIGTNIGGINEIIDHMSNGLLFEKGNPADLSKQIVRLLEDERLRTRIARAGKERVETWFNMDRVAKETEALFYQLIERS